MSVKRSLPILDYLRKVFGASANAGTSDAELLRRFVAERDEAAFELLMWRHAATVLHVCRRVLRDEQSVEDAFQATFLVFVRKAESISQRESLGGWLYRVAYRIALKARTQTAKHQEMERESISLDLPDTSTEDAEQRELRRIICEEVDRLPAQYRAAIVACFFEGKTHEEAAQQLGWPRGTVASRVARGRDILHRRLIRRGITLTVGALGTALSTQTSTATLAGLLRATVQTVKLFAAGASAEAVVPPSILALAEGVLQAMYWTKIKLAAIVLMLATMGGAGVGVYYLNAQGPAPETEKPVKGPGKTVADQDSGKKTDELTALMQERLKLAQDVLKATQERQRSDINISQQDLVDASERVLKADLELSSNKEARIAAHKRHVKMAEDFARSADAAIKGGFLKQSDALLMRYLMIDAKIGLEREKERK